MNERLREIAIKAQVEHCISHVRLEEFAELIVLECAQVCLEQRDPANLNYKPSVKFAEAVKQHFGVQE
jgi:hypothetical protein